MHILPQCSGSACIFVVDNNDDIYNINNDNDDDTF